MGDSNKRHRLETELIERVRSEASVFQFVTDNCLDGTWFWDLDSPEHEFMDARFWETLGIDPASKAHLASEWQSLIHPDDLEVAINNFERHCEDPNHPYDQIVRYRHSEGHWVHVRCRGVAMRDETGKPVRMLGVHSDVTELANATQALAAREKELEAREAELRLVFDAVPSIIMVKDDENRILRGNSAAAESLGISVEDLEGADSYELYPEMAAKYHADDLAVIESGEPLKGIVESLAPAEGDTGWVRTDKIPTVLPDGKRGLVLVATDITELKRKEARLAALSEASRQFASVAAHDLRAPLRQSAVLLEMLRSELAEKDVTLSSDGDFALNHMTASLQRMLSMVGDLHTLSKLESREFEMRPVALAACVKHAISLRSDEIRAAKADVQNADLPQVQGSEALIVDVFSNLLANACQHSGEADVQISVDAHRDVEARRHLIRLSDRGKGFAKADRARAFEPFTRLDHRSSDEGSGLGLAIVKRVMTAHGGDVWIDADYEPGARIVLAFPFVDGDIR